MIFAQSTSSDDSSSYDVVRSLFIYTLYDPCYYCPQSFLAFLLITGGQQIRSQMTQPLHEASAHTLSNCKLKLLCILTGTLHFLVKNSTPLCTVMLQVLWLSPSSERTRPYVETFERKLRDVRFLEIKKFQLERVS